MVKARGGRLQVSARRVELSLFSYLLFSACVALAQEVPPVTLRVDIVGGVPGADDGETVEWRLEVPPPPAECVDVQAEVLLVSRVEPCFSEPELCDGSENFVETGPGGVPLAFGCSDGVDNDEDGLVDELDLDCVGVTGWVLSVGTDDCFNIESATVEGTVADLLINPPGRRNFQSFEGHELVTPGFNGGQAGAVATCVLSISSLVVLEVGEHPILRLSGKLSTAGLASPGDRTAPCQVRVFDPGESGLVGSALPRATSVSAGATRLDVEVSASAIQLELAGGEPVFLRGDAEGNGDVALADAVATFGYLFLGGVELPCQDAADADDDGRLQINDGIHVLGFLFLGGAEPAAPGPFRCDVDPTPDALDCAVAGSCPAAEPSLCSPPPEDDPLLFCRRSELSVVGGRVLLVDVDRDGNADLVTDDGISLVVFLSDGNEGFSPPELFDNGTALGVNDIAHGDIDDDGLPDVVVAGRTGLTTFFNFAGIFVPSFTQDVGDAASLALGELDDEGFLDAVVMLQDGTAVILSGAGDGSFQVTQTHTVRQGDGRYSIALGDIQGNGDLDLVVADLEGQLHLLSNQGRGVFNPPVTQPGVARGRAPLFGHLDGDGLLDLAVSTISGNGCADLIRLYHGRDDGTLAVGEGVLPHADSGGSKGRRGGIEAAALADFNGDGILDLVVGTAFDGPREQPGRVAILAGLGNGTFGPATYTTPGVFENWFAAGDIDGDGDLDLAMGKGPGGVSVLINCTVP